MEEIKSSLNEFKKNDEYRVATCIQISDLK